MDSFYPILGVSTSLNLFLQEELRVDTLNFPLNPPWKPDPFELPEISARRDKGEIAAEEDSVRSDDSYCQSVDLRAVEKRGCGRVVENSLGGPGNFRHEIIEEKTPSPMSQNDIYLRNEEEELVDRLEGFQALARIFVSHWLIGMEKKGDL